MVTISFQAEDDEDIEIIMEKRKRTISETCAKWKQAPVLPYQHIYKAEGPKHLIYNHKKGILYCYLPKVANTNFRRVFFGLNGDVSAEKVRSLDGYQVYFIMADKMTYLFKEAPAERTRMMAEYRKFLVVREPLERLLSGYRNKFFHPNSNHQAEYHSKYLEFYHRHPQLKYERKIRTNFTAGPLTFVEFLVYFVDCFETSYYMNEHFVPGHLLCPPCEIEFDYIGKYETINRDAKFIFDKLNIDIDFPGKNDNYSSVSTTVIAEQYYSKVPSHVMKKVMTILEPDYTIFGYDFPEWLKRKLSK